MEGRGALKTDSGQLNNFFRKKSYKLVMLSLTESGKSGNIL